MHVLLGRSPRRPMPDAVAGGRRRSFDARRESVPQARSQRGRVTSSTCVNVTARVRRSDGGGVDLVDRAVGAGEQVADEADHRVLVERDDDDVVGRELGVRRQQRGMRDREGPDRRRARSIASQVWSSDRQTGHIGRGGIRRWPHDAQVCTSSSPRAVPSQNGAEISSSRSGSSQVGSTVATRWSSAEQHCARRDAFAAGDQARLGALDLGGRRAAASGARLRARG